MQYLFKSLFLFFIVAKLVTEKSIPYAYIIIILTIIASNIIREKYCNTIYLIIFEFIITTFAITLNPYFSVFYGIIAYDLVTKKKYIWVAFIAAFTSYFLNINLSPEILLIIGICSLLSYLNNGYKEKTELLTLSYDKSRKYSYELELTKIKLMNSLAETVHITEVKERNRIAREIHDHIGHRIAGVLISLQASYKLFASAKDHVKSMELLEQSIEKLSDSLTIIKNTVYNIKPNEDFGIKYITEMINDFSFCPVEFKYSGDFNKLGAHYTEIISTNIKEALTNSAKHSNASKIDISLDINDNFLRLYIKDNGIGCTNIKDGLGLSGIRERIKNIGGNISINGSSGFLIVCVIPLNREVGNVFEDFNS